MSYDTWKNDAPVMTDGLEPCDVCGADEATVGTMCNDCDYEIDLEQQALDTPEAQAAFREHPMVVVTTELGEQLRVAFVTPDGVARTRTASPWSCMEYVRDKAHEWGVAVEYRKAVSR